MTGSQYRILTEWSLAASPEEVWAVLAEVTRLPRWCPKVYLAVEEKAAGGEEGIGRVLAMHTRGFLPYTLDWTLTVVAARRPAELAVEAAGDLVGAGRWTLAAAGRGSRVVYDWRVEADKPMLRLLGPVLRPLFAANHRWAMARMREGLEREIGRRRAH